MIANLQPYPEYKESGLPWLGRIPAHWREWRLDRLFELRKEAPSTEDQRVTAYLNGRVTLRTNVQGQKIKGVVKEAGWQRVYPGDFAISGMNAHLGGMGVSDSLGKCSPIYLVLNPKPGTNAHFLSHAVRHIAHMGALKSFVDTIRFNSADFKRDSLKLFRVLLPDECEQAGIVRFLDWVSGRIERTVLAKKKLIKLLTEQKQAIIHRAVTRGLDPTVSLKPSGIPWLGDIPKHWEIAPLKFLCRRIQNGATPPTSEQRYYENGTVPWFGPSSIGISYELGAPVCYLTKAAFSDGKARLINGPAILVIVIGATAGRMNLLVGEGATNQQITAFELKKDKIIPQFGSRQLRSSENWLKSTASSATIPILDSAIVNRLPVAFPSLDEQQAILSAISLQTGPLDAVIARLEREIELLREYRTRLAADVVTGKLDVREAAKNLPAEAEEPSLEFEPGEQIEDEVTTDE